MDSWNESALRPSHSGPSLAPVELGTLGGSASFRPRRLLLLCSKLHAEMEEVVQLQGRQEVLLQKLLEREVEVVSSTEVWQ